MVGEAAKSVVSDIAIKSPLRRIKPAECMPSCAKFSAAKGSHLYRGPNGGRHETPTSSGFGLPCSCIGKFWCNSKFCLDALILRIAGSFASHQHISPIYRPKTETISVQFTLPDATARRSLALFLQALLAICLHSLQDATDCTSFRRTQRYLLDLVANLHCCAHLSCVQRQFHSSGSLLRKTNASSSLVMRSIYPRP